MADVTYPSGVSSFATIASATEVTNVSAVLGTIGLGEGKPTVGNRWGMGVVLHIVLDANSGTDSLSFTFDASDDGTNWYDIDEYNITASDVDAIEGSIRLHLQPFTFGALNLRISASSGAGSPNPIVTVTGRLTDVFEVVGGVS
jgi:hypothetical protein